MPRHLNDIPCPMEPSYPMEPTWESELDSRMPSISKLFKRFMVDTHSLAKHVEEKNHRELYIELYRHYYSLPTPDQYSREYRDLKYIIDRPPPKPEE